MKRIHKDQVPERMTAHSYGAVRVSGGYEEVKAQFDDLKENNRSLRSQLQVRGWLHH